MASQFRGWYFKCQSKEHTLALIPAIHQGPQGRECSLQLISPENSQTVSLPSQGAVIRWDRPEGQMNGFSFSPKGLTLNISTSKTRLRGQLSFGPPASLSGYHGSLSLCALSGMPPPGIQHGPLGGRTIGMERTDIFVFPRPRIYRRRSRPLFPQALCVEPMSFPSGVFDAVCRFHPSGALLFYRRSGPGSLPGTGIPAGHLSERTGRKNPTGGDPHPARTSHTPGQPALFRSPGAVCSRSGPNVPPDPGKHHRPCPLCASQW